MNKISVFGREMSKLEFFDHIYDVESDLIMAAQDINKDVCALAANLNILRQILKVYDLSAEYQAWAIDYTNNYTGRCL